jgi:hypothetical protein
MPEPARKDFAILVKGLYPHAEVLQAATVGHIYELELKEPDSEIDWKLNSWDHVTPAR